MPSARARGLFGRRFFRHLWRLTRLYWVSADAPIGWALLAVSLAGEFATVYGNVLLAEVQRNLFDGLQNKEMALFFHALWYFVVIFLGFLLVSTYRIYVRQLLEIRWRRWLTDHYLGCWMGSQAYYRMELHEKHTDNPDQRIAEDVRDYVASALGLSLSLVSAIATLVSFVAVLWGLSERWMIKLGSLDLHIPGFMVWVALLYSGLSTWITHLVGRRLVPINFDQQRFEADFRYSMVRFRENVEAVAFYRGEDSERRLAQGRFHRVVDNWRRLVRAQLDLSLFTTGFSQLNSVVPLLVAAPGFFLGRLTLGDVIQTRIAYVNVSSALTWLVNAYGEIAHWRASVERLFSFTEDIERAYDELAHDERGIDIEPTQDPVIRLTNLRLEVPGGRVLLDGVNGTIARGDRVLVAGPSGTGKSTLFRAIAGLWPFGRGRIDVSEKGKRLFLPQRAYLPIGTLRAAVSYPAPEGTFSDEQIRETLRTVGLEQLADQLDRDAHWEQELSGGEQQRLSITRVLLHAPDWIFLDEATAALDEAMEEHVYGLIEDRLPNATIVSVAHRPTVAQFHTRRWTLRRQGDHMALETA